jgi:hypothetical protein
MTQLVDCNINNTKSILDFVYGLFAVCQLHLLCHVVIPRQKGVYFGHVPGWAVPAAVHSLPHAPKHLCGRHGALLVLDLHADEDLGTYLVLGKHRVLQSQPIVVKRLERGDHLHFFKRRDLATVPHGLGGNKENPPVRKRVGHDPTLPQPVPPGKLGL